MSTLWNIKKINVEKLKKDNINNYPSLKNFKLHWYYFIPILGYFWFDKNIKLKMKYAMVTDSFMLTTLFKSLKFCPFGHSTIIWKWGNLFILILMIVATFLLLFIGNWVLNPHPYDDQIVRAYFCGLLWVVYLGPSHGMMIGFNYKINYLKTIMD